MFHYSKCPIFLTEKKLERYPQRRNTQKYSIDFWAKVPKTHRKGFQEVQPLKIHICGIHFPLLPLLGKFIRFSNASDYMCFIWWGLCPPAVSAPWGSWHPPLPCQWHHQVLSQPRDPLFHLNELSMVGSLCTLQNQLQIMSCTSFWKDERR